MAILQNNILTGNNSWGMRLGDSISKGLTAGENLAKVKKEDDTKKFFDERQRITNDIETGKITSGNKAQDTMTVRTNNIVQAFSAYALKKGANPEKVKELSKKPDEIISRLTKQGGKKAQAINDYLMKGGYAERAVNYAVGLSDSPYEKTYEEKNLLEKGMDKVKNTSVGNFVSSALATPVKSVVGLGNIVSNITGKALGIDKEKGKQERNDRFNSLSDEGYNSFKKTGKGGNDFETVQYKAYDNAKNEGFDGNIEEFIDYKRREHEGIESITDAINNYIDTNVYDPKKTSASVGKIGGEILELALTPELKLKYATKLPGVGKYLGKLGEYFAEKTPKLLSEGSKASKFVNSTKKGLSEGVELQALDDLYEGELSPTEKYGVNSVLNVVTRGLLNGVGKGFRYMLGPSGMAEKAIGTKTASEWNEMTRIVDNAKKDSNAEITPMTKISEKLTEGWEKIKDNGIKSGKEVELARKGLEYGEKPYTSRDIISDIQEAFGKLKKENGWGENSKLPEFIVSKDGKTLSIKNKATLNSITKTEGNQTLKLGDEIEKLWEQLYKTADKDINATTTDEFIRSVKNVLGDKGWGGSSPEGMKTMREVLKVIDDKFENSLTEGSSKTWKEALDKSAKDIRLKNTYESLIGKLDGKNNVEAVGAAEKASMGNEAVRELFKEVKKATNDKIDMNNEIGAWIANMSQFGPDNAKKLAEMIYPSMPGMYEFLLKNTMGGLRRLVTPSYTKDFANKTIWGQINKNLNKGTSVAGNVAGLLNNE